MIIGGLLADAERGKTRSLRHLHFARFTQRPGRQLTPPSRPWLQERHTVGCTWTQGACSIEEHAFLPINQSDCDQTRRSIGGDAVPPTPPVSHPVDSGSAYRI